MKGYAYSRDDVRARALANAYSQAMGDVFTRELKPLEVEVIVAEVGDDSLAGHEKNAIYRVQFDGSISDHQGFCVIGGAADELDELPEGASSAPGSPWGRRCSSVAPRSSAPPRASRASAPRTSRSAFSSEAARGRKFRRLSTDELRELLGS